MQTTPSAVQTIKARLAAAIERLAKRLEAESPDYPGAFTFDADEHIGIDDGSAYNWPPPDLRPQFIIDDEIGWQKPPR